MRSSDLLNLRSVLIMPLVLLTALASVSSNAAESTPAKKKSKFADFSKTVEDAKKYEGLFTLYKKDNHLYAAIKPSLYNTELIAPMAIARGLASAGTPLNMGDEWILYFRRVGDRIQLVRKNIHYQAPKGTPLEKAVKQNYTDSVLKSLPIISMAPGGAPLIDLSSIFFTDFAQLGIGALDRTRTSWHQVKAFKNNIELQVEATFSSSRYGRFGDDGVADSRGVTVILHYGLTKRPPSGYKPRYADQRVGHFISATKDFGSKNSDTTFVRRINRWRLEKADPKAKLSAPKKQLVWWVEDTVPHEYRPYVEEGILEWNKAFRKIGFRNAIGVRWQNEGDEFDAEDTNYCTFRWITTPSTFAMSGLRADPITGEMIDGDVIFDASWVRVWKDEYALLMGAPVPAASGDSQAQTQSAVLGVGEILSPMMAVKQGYGLPFTPQSYQLSKKFNEYGQPAPTLVPADHGPIHRQLSKRLAHGSFSACQCAIAKRHEYQLAAMVLAANAADDDAKDDDAKDGDDDDKDEDGKDDDDKDDEKVAEKEDKEITLPEELLGQAIKEIVMHEVGHSLGLRHNFKASTMLSLEEINDPEITRVKGMGGSVMDYNPLNIVGKGKKQGDYATTTIGPYDYWAIEYAYKPIRGNEEKELEKIAARSPEGDLTYATDEDMYASNDPLVNVYDLGDDPLEYMKTRVELAAELMDDLDDKIVRDGESWARLRRAFSVLVGQYGNAAFVGSSYIGGQSISRDHKGGEESRDPFVPISGAKQREALDFLVDTILSDEAFQFSPELLRRIKSDHWYHWGSRMSMNSGEVNVYDRVLRIQQIVLRHCFDGSVLKRLQNQQLLTGEVEDEANEPLPISEVFRTLTDSIWSELAEPDGQLKCSVIRRNLQRDHLSRLNNLVLGDSRNPFGDLYGFAILTGGSSSYPADARSLARMHLIEIAERIEGVLENDGLKIEETTRAHLSESHDLIEKVLEARLQSNRS